MRINTIIKAKL